ncbi:MAG TPA: hypothetical protein VFF00_02480 [Candidatus Elarobacter sp.]|nr:hypothetical protein [Dongiaceae bacterium]HZW52869.1 hypothetical protein [Candidatus Elarobacter sp.]
MRSVIAAALGALLITAGAGPACAQVNAPVPDSCDGSVNEKLTELIHEQHDGPVEQVMVCGRTIGPSRRQKGGPHGDHQILPLRVPLDGGGNALVEVVTNDSLDGKVTAPKGAQVYAYGQYFLTSDRQRPFVAGVHDVHCATHRGAANGWVVVNDRKYPRRACTRR